ncbi:MAG: hypothetical protein AAGK04_08765 [Planctomycetota bacterium]
MQAAGATWFVLVLAALVCARPAAAGKVANDDLFDVPRGVIGWWAFDPTRFASVADRAVERRLLETGIQAALSAGLIRDQEAAYAVAALLGGSVAGSAPHRVCVLDFEAKPINRAGGMRLEEFQVVLELRTGDDHRGLVRALRAIVVEAEDVEEDLRPAGVQRTVELAPGREGVVYTRADWPTWREVSWHSGDDAFYVGFGRDALRDWFSLQAADAAAEGEPSPAWSAHTRAVEVDRAGDVFMSAYCSIDALRRGFPEAFERGRAVRTFASMGLSNARELMLHGRWAEQDEGPPLLAIDASWSPRSRAPGTASHREMTTDAWPADVGRIHSPPGSYAMVVRGEWSQWLALGVNAYGASRGEFAAMTFQAKARRWVRDTLPSFRRLADSMGPWVVLSDVPRPPAPIPGLATVFAEAKAGADAATMDRDLAAVLASLGEDRVVHDRETGIRSLRVLPQSADPAGVVRAVSFLVVDRAERPPVLLISWSPSGVREALRWVESR